MSRRNTTRRVLGAAVAAIGVIALDAAAAHAYPPEPPDDDRGISVNMLSPNCDDDVLAYSYSISPIGFESNGPVSVMVSDLNGEVITEITDGALTGTFVLPGTILPSRTAGLVGTATNSPASGFRGAQGLEDPSEATGRNGFRIRFVLGSATATRTVDAAVAAEECAGSAVGSAAPGRQPTQQSPAPAQGSLPSTGGSGVPTTLGAAGAALVVGLALTVWPRSSARRTAPTTPMEVAARRDAGGQ